MRKTVNPLVGRVRRTSFLKRDGIPVIITGKSTHVCAHTLVVGVFSFAARLGNLLSVLHPEALVMGAVGAGQVALQCQVVFHGQRDVLRWADGRFCRERGGHGSVP